VKTHLKTKEANEHWIREEKSRGKMPLRLPVGADAWGLIRGDLDAFSAELNGWRVVSE
jgi:hypothetical protein